MSRAGHLPILFALLLPIAALADGGAARRPTDAPALPPVGHPDSASRAVSTWSGILPPDLVLETMRESDEALARDDDPSDPVYAPREWGAAKGAGPGSGGALRALGADLRINGPGAANNCEAELSLSAQGLQIVAGWNDGASFGVRPGATGWGYSVDGGATWIDAGSPPTTGLTDIYYGDPVIVSEPAGHWYLASLYRPSAGQYAISVNHGMFVGSTLVWANPYVIAVSGSDVLDKPWLATDPVSGAVYVAYVRFFGAGGQRLEFSRSLDHGVTWSAPIALSDPATSGDMSPRLRVGPNGEVFLAYYCFSRVDSKEYLRIRRSNDAGLTFGPEANIGGRAFMNNFYSGPAGFNRERVVAQVSFDVDLSSAPSRGTLIAVWNEGVDFNRDLLGTTGVVNEVEPDDASAQATPFTLGATLHGALAGVFDQDWFSFTGLAGQVAEFSLTPVDASCNGYLRLFAGGGATANRVAYSHFSGGRSPIEFTLPSTGTYYLRVLNWDGFTADIGAYQVVTGAHTPSFTDVARDHRDIMLSRSSDGGTTWSPPTRVSDTPPGFDEIWPEVAIDAAHRVFVSWYGHVGDPANGILTDVYVARSDDSGRTFGASARVNAGPSVNWNNVASNMFPNMGDYSALIADGMNVYANWTDGRGGSPDSYFSRVVDATAEVAPAPVHANSLAVRAAGVAMGRLRVLLTLPHAGAVRLRAFDLAGRAVATRDLAAAGAGEHPLELGEGLAAGVYLVRVDEAGVTASAKVVALR